jgi:UPF0755 protein
MADSERSAQEREAARLERERRRAQQRGEAVVDESAVSPDGRGAEPPELEHGAPELDLGGAEPPELDGHRPVIPAPDLDDEPTDQPTGEGLEAPLGTRRATHLDRVRTQGRRGERAPVRPRRGRTSPVRRRARTLAPSRSSWVGRALSVVAILVSVLVIWFLVELFQPFHGSGQGRITVTIAPHSGVSQIGDQLERDGVISSSFFFNLRTILAGDRGSLLAGTYTLHRDMSYGDVLAVLTTPLPAAKVTSVTTVPGETRAQLDALLRPQGVKGSYRSDTRHSPLLDPVAYGAPRSTPTLEGFLFPDTFQLRSPISIPALVADQLKEFKRVFATVKESYARSQNLTPYDVLIVASIIEKEAATARDRPLVAAVIYNRLRHHIPLGMDSTTRYEFNDYNKSLTQSQLASPSPYNTRLHVGLPPTPISNPGLAAIEAAAHPAHVNYVYFVAKACGNGDQRFTASYDQFLTWSAQYQAARASNGGRLPAHC